MHWNYVKIAWRNIRKHKLDSFISLTGLSVGLACCILLLMYIQFEWSYDSFHENRDSMYRVVKEYQYSNQENIEKTLTQPYVQSFALKEDFPEIETIVNISRITGKVLSGSKFIDELLYTVDHEFLTIFTFPLLHGNSETALLNTNSIVLTKASAVKYFGKTDVLGETLTIRLLDEARNYTITGVTEDIPLNSSLTFDFLLPFENYFRNETPERAERYRENWYLGFVESWIVLNPHTPPEQLEDKFPAFLQKHFDNSFIERQNAQLSLQAFTGSYFDESIRSYYTTSSNKTYMLIIGTIAIIILVIAGINFMTLTLSRASSRFHEIGIRKTIGAARHQIQSQIVGEVFVTCTIAILIGLLLVEIAAPYTGFIFNKELNLSLFNDPGLWIGILALLTVLTLITSMYPAIIIASKKTVSLFSGYTFAQKTPPVVKGLLIIQFGVSITLMIGTYVLQQQLGYLLEKDLGYNPENVVAIQIDPEVSNAKKLATLFAEESKKISSISDASVTSSELKDYSQYEINTAGMGLGMTGTSLAGFDLGVATDVIDERYLETLGIELVSGYNFTAHSNAYASDEIIVNEAFAEIMGWENPIGEIIEDKPEGNWINYLDGKKVVGVVENFHFKSLYDPLQPIVLQHIEGTEKKPGTILVKISSDNMSATISELESLWNTIFPEEIFSFAFLDELVANQYQKDTLWNRIILLSAGMSVLLTCFGLLGLTALATQRRIKEIGIRKVFGASIRSIVELISKDFVLMIFVGFTIAAPVAYYFSNQWLSNFAYKIGLGITPFILGGATTLAIALTTISWQSIRAALANPVESLRNE